VTATAEDGQLVDLVHRALTNPDVHTDLRLRLSNEIASLLADGGDHIRERAAAAEPHEMSHLLREVLADPNVHTDLRMRLHNDIPRLLSA
jgi:hypothetical protein